MSVFMVLIKCHHKNTIFKLPSMLMASHPLCLFVFAIVNHPRSNHQQIGVAMNHSQRGGLNAWFHPHGDMEDSIPSSHQTLLAIMNLEAMAVAGHHGHGLLKRTSLKNRGVCIYIYTLTEVYNYPDINMYIYIHIYYMYIFYIYIHQQ